MNEEIRIIAYYCYIGHLDQPESDKFLKEEHDKLTKVIEGSQFKKIIIIPLRSGESRIEILM